MIVMILSSFFPFPWLYSLWNHSPNPTSSCLSSTSFDQFIDCLDGYTVPEGAYTNLSYSLAQPTSDQLSGWTEAIEILLNATLTGEPCGLLEVPNSISDVYKFTSVPEDYCVLSEIGAVGGEYFAKGWGTFAVPSKKNSRYRELHFSAPHPGFDVDTPQQASALFGLTEARSLLLAGRHRQALMESTPCIQPSSSGTVYYRTDPTHDVDDPFFSASMTILDWQMRNGGCPSDKCAFVQFHAKRDTSCSEDQAFLSSGIGRSPASLSWYTDTIDRPIKRIVHSARQHFDTITGDISLPSDSDCGLLATKNVVGRVMNGVDRQLVCEVAARGGEASGMFVHIEQAALARSKASYETWRKVFMDAFPIGG